MKFFNFLIFTAVIFLSGCATYLGKEKVYEPIRISENELDSKALNRYWQYNIANGKITLTNSEVRSVLYEKTEAKPYYYRESYLDYPLDKISFWADLVHNQKEKNPVVKFLKGTVITVTWGWIHIIGDICRWGYRLLEYPCKVNSDWHLKEDGPNVFYLVAYLPLIANFNPFMLPPYIVDAGYVARHLKYELTPVKKDTSTFRYRAEKEFGIPRSDSRYLFINDRKVSLANMAKGKKTIDLNQKNFIPYMLPAKNVRLRVTDKNKTVIDLTVKTTDIINGEYLYMWNVVNDKKANYHTRFSALNKLHALGVMDNEYFLKIQKSILDE